MRHRVLFFLFALTPFFLLLPSFEKLVCDERICINVAELPGDPEFRVWLCGSARVNVGCAESKCPVKSYSAVDAKAGWVKCTNASSGQAVKVGWPSQHRVRSERGADDWRKESERWCGWLSAGI